VNPRDYLAARPVPKDIVRDLLAICRVLYSTRKAEGAGPPNSKRSNELAKAFAQALSMSHCKGETIGAPRSLAVG
jgi:hypothetical protein